MRFNRQAPACLALLAWTLLAVPDGKSFSNYSPAIVGPATQAAAETKNFRPADLFPDFPAISWGMSFQAARQAIQKNGIDPVAFRDSRTELVWDGKFATMDGRATIFLKEDSGVWEIAVVAFAMERQKEIFEEWTRQVTARHGGPKEVHDDSSATSRIWQLKDGIALELRAPKDPGSPVVDIHWVKK